MILRMLIGLGAGGSLGALIGYFGHCSGGACPLTANPWRGATYGAVLGILFALSGSRADPSTSSTGPVCCPPPSPNYPPASVESPILERTQGKDSF